jgi:hypothetical protein
LRALSPRSTTTDSPTCRGAEPKRLPVPRPASTTHSCSRSDRSADVDSSAYRGAEPKRPPVPRSTSPARSRFRAIGPARRSAAPANGASSGGRAWAPASSGSGSGGSAGKRAPVRPVPDVRCFRRPEVLLGGSSCVATTPSQVGGEPTRHDTTVSPLVGDGQVSSLFHDRDPKSFQDTKNRSPHRCRRGERCLSAD